jgi:hypothetical protein
MDLLGVAQPAAVEPSLGTTVLHMPGIHRLFLLGSLPEWEGVDLHAA